MWKRYLVGIDGSDEARTALKCAIDMAKRFSGTITALNIVDQAKVTQSMMSPGVPYAPIDIKPLSFYAELQEKLTAMGQAALKDAAEIAAKEKVGFNQGQTMGLPGDILTHAAKSHDCLFIGKRGFSDDKKALGKEVLHVAKHCPRPVLVADEAFHPIEKVLIAYDGSPEAAHALRVAVELGGKGCTESGGKGGYEFHLVTVSEPQRTGETTIEEAREYLTPHGVKVEYHLMSGDPSEQVLFAAAKYGCSMVLMGAFGHRTFWERAFGSTSNKILRDCKLPILLAK